MRCHWVACAMAAWMMLMGPSVASEDVPSITTISKQLARTSLLRADFQQERTLRILSRPLESRGQLLFLSGQGLLWDVTSPQQTTLVIAPDRVIEFTDGTARPLAMGASPIFRILAQVFNAALSGELEGLTELFVLSPEKLEEGWHLLLTPKAADLLNMVARIELGGAKYVEEIRIIEASGDETLIRLSNFRTEPAALSDREKVYFAD